MKNSDLNNEYLDDEIDLRELLRAMLNSKKLIIILTLAFSLLAFIYSTQKELEYQSNIIASFIKFSLNSGEGDVKLIPKKWFSIELKFNVFKFLET